ncbi:glycosyltransferase family 2 protein [Thermovirga sp.]|uniref:glycosyltransferase family 2 protein n=1 Tax=Thermovirga sp. TaxID=2699834 RepID=UPI0025FBB82B|nr:glycosyltransferase family 2 protein [Thermovirga sp.]MBO8154589.1 glycosyltransferase family 2 protein [Thermovirga sp.]
MGKLLSIVVPVYNGASKFLMNTLEYLENQDYSPMELILVDDGSQDNSLSLMKNFACKSKHSVKVIHQENAGVCVARNRGFIASKGEYIAFFDGDDIFSPNCCSKLVEAMKRHQADMVFCGYDFADHEGKIFKKYTEKYRYPNGEFERGLDVLSEYLLGRVDLWGGAVLYRRSFLEQNNISYTEGCHCAEDNEVFVKSLAVAKKVAVVKESLVAWRKHASSTTSSSDIVKFYSNLHELTAYLRCRAFMKRVGKQNTKAYELLTKLIIPSAYTNYLQKILVDKGEEYLKKLIENRSFKEQLKESCTGVLLHRRPDLFFKLFLAVSFPDLYVRLAIFRQISKARSKKK